MPSFVNLHFLEQTHFDSGSPTGLSGVVRAFQEPGEFVVTFLRDDQIIERVHLSVVAESPQPEPRRRRADTDLAAELREPRPEPLPTQVSIDLRQIRRGLPGHPVGELTERFVVRAGGHVMLSASSGESSHAILVEPMQGKGEPFDSRRLGAGDLFAVTLIRPGSYTLANELTGAKGEITVAYPTVGKEPYRPPVPVTVECTERGFRPDRIALKPAQGLIFRVQAPSRIKIDLVKPDDGPVERLERAGERGRPGVAPRAEGASRPVARWRKPQPGE